MKYNLSRKSGHWITLLCGWALTAHSVSAQDTGWTNPGLGNWFVSSNWDNGVPGNDDTAYLVNYGTAFINSPGATSADLQVLDGATLLIGHGGTLFNSVSAEIETPLSNTTPKVVVSDSGSSWILGGPLSVSAHGMLRIDTGAHTIVNSYVRIDGYSGFSAAATVTGTGSVLNVHYNLYVGSGPFFELFPDGDGSLEVDDGATVQASSLRVASKGSVVVNNGDTNATGLIITGGVLPHTTGGALGSLIVADTDHGHMEVHGGGVVSSAVGQIGRGAGFTGVATVTGAGSQWINNSDLVVGAAGSGYLEVLDGGVVSSLRGFLGVNAGSYGVVNVEGPGSTWTAAGSFFIGNSGHARLTVSQGGSASTTGNAYLGYTAGSDGFALANGAGSTLNIAGQLNIGGTNLAAGGNGTLILLDGGTVNVGSTTNLYSTGFLSVQNASFTSDLNAYGGKISIFGNTTFTSPVHLHPGGVTVEAKLSNDDTVFESDIDGDGGLSKTGDHGTVALIGMNTYAGNTTIDGGTLLVDGSITSPTTVNSGGILGGSGTVGAVTIMNVGILAPGSSPGRLTAGDTTFDTSGLGAGSPTLAIQLGGTDPGTQYDQLDVQGNLSLDGILNVSLMDDFVPTAGASFDILDWTSLTGTFATVNLPTLTGGRAWDTTALYTTGVLSVTGPSLPGDFDHDGDVDGGDFLVWQRGNSPNGINSGDLALWQSHYNSPPLAANANAVPEPASVLLLFLGFTWITTFARQTHTRNTK